ncbi:MAG: SRPBCC domain-containing protein [Gammaproteobacteria bacterium]|nr:SRPBCC domain-containing protein [Gammaproteobacteria bacterium]
MGEPHQYHRHRKPRFSLTRLIKAPREQVFKAWTDPALLKRWFTPRPWTTPIVETDVREGWGQAADQLAALLEKR